MSNHRHWLEIAEYASLVALVLGTVVAAVSGQVIYVALPVSVSLSLNSINRLRFEQQTRRRTTGAIIRLHEELSEDILSLEEKVFDLVSTRKQPVLPYSQTALESKLITYHQLEEAIATLQNQLSSRLSQLEALNLQTINKDVALQRRLITSLQERCASLEKTLSNAIEHQNNSLLPPKVNDLEKGLVQISEAIASIQARLDDAMQPKIDANEAGATIEVKEPQPCEDIDIATLPVKAASSVQPQTWCCIRTFTGHSDWVRCLAISPDGQTLVSGSFDKTIKLWHLSEGRLIRTLSEHSKGVFAVAITPDGQTLASGSWDETIKLWQMNTGNPIDTFTEHSGSVRSLAIASAIASSEEIGQTLISGSFDKTIKLWSLARRKLIGTLTENAGHVYAIALSPAKVEALGEIEQILASGGEDGIINLWALNKGEYLGTLRGDSTNTVWSLAISPDGQILSCGSGDGTIKLWHLQTREMTAVLNGHSGQVMSVVISPDGQTLISGSADGTIKLWHLTTGEYLHTLTGDSSASVISIAISPQGDILASGSVDGTIKVWQLQRTEY